MFRQWSWLVQQYLARDNIAQVQQRPYSPDFTACHFFLFKNQIPTNFKVVEVIQEDATRQLLAIPQKQFPGMLPSMKTTLDKVSGFRYWTTSKEIKCLIDMCCSFYYYYFFFVFMIPVPIVFDQPPYRGQEGEIEKKNDWTLEDV